MRFYNNINGNISSDPELQNAYQQFLQYIANGLENASFIPQNISPCDFIDNSYDEARSLIGNTINEILNNYNAPLYDYTQLYMIQNNLSIKDVAEDVIEFACDDTLTIEDAPSTSQNDFTGTVLEGINSPEEFAEQFDEYFIAEYLYNMGECNGNFPPNNANLNMLVMGLKNEAYSVGGQEYINAVIAYQPNIDIISSVMKNYCQGIPNVGDDDLGTPPAIGCTDPQASNYDPAATVDGGGCEYDDTYSLEGECDELEAENQQLQTQLNYLAESHAYVNESLDMANEQINDLQQLNQDYEIQLEMLTAISDVLQQEIDYLADQYYGLLHNLENYAEDMGYDININNESDVYEFFEVLYYEGNNNEEIQQLQSALNSSQTQIQELIYTIDSLSNALEGSSQTIADLENNNQSYESEIAFLQSELMQVMNQLNTSNANSEALQATIQQLQADLEGCNNLEDLDNIVNNYNTLLSQFNTVRRQMADLLKNPNRPNPVRPNPVRQRQIIRR